MTAPTCPHGGHREVTYNVGSLKDPAVCVLTLHCGEHGWLCHACREDRQDQRADRLVEGLAMAALLQNPGFIEELWKAGAAGRVRVAASFAHDCAAALRAERERGDG